MHKKPKHVQLYPFPKKNSRVFLWDAGWWFDDVVMLVFCRTVLTIFDLDQIKFDQHWFVGRNNIWTHLDYSEKCHCKFRQHFPRQSPSTFHQQRLIETKSTKMKNRDAAEEEFLLQLKKARSKRCCSIFHDCAFWNGIRF